MKRQSAATCHQSNAAPDDGVGWHLNPCIAAAGPHPLLPLLRHLRPRQGKFTAVLYLCAAGCHMLKYLMCVHSTAASQVCAVDHTMYYHSPPTLR